jgi:methionyl-tRNA synthetase
MDEHAIKVQRAAEKAGLTPQVYCDQMSEDVQKVLKQFRMNYDRFIRTSDSDHLRVVQMLVQKAFDRGDIYKGKYEGYYCEGCEAFYTEKDLVEGKCPSHATVPKWISEENYFFKLSKYQDQLLKLFESSPKFLQPEHRVSEILNFIKAGLKDFSISRSNFTWGVPLPFDSKNVIYVWFDALINYLTAAGIEHKLKNPNSSEAKLFDQRWPASVHIVGKDIARFHCVYWPAMLMALELPLPEQVFAHGWVSVKGDRMSKSSGNVVTPDEVIAVSSSDAFRYYMLAENQFSGDAAFSVDSLVLKHNADLANDWGNLVNRSISMTRKYFPDMKLSKPKNVSSSSEVIESFLKFKSELTQAIDEINPCGYVEACRARSRLLNLYIDKMKPWSLAKVKSEETEAQLHEVMFTLLEGIRWVATAFMSVIPDGMGEVFKQLNVTAPAEQGALQKLQWGDQGFQPGEPKPVFPRIEPNAS